MGGTPSAGRSVVLVSSGEDLREGGDMTLAAFNTRPFRLAFTTIPLVVMLTLAGAEPAEAG